MAALFVSPRRPPVGPAQVFEDGRQRRDFVHVDDVAAAVVAAVTVEVAPEAFTRSTSDPEPITTVGEMATAISTAMRRTGRR